MRKRDVLKGLALIALDEIKCVYQKAESSARARLIEHGDREPILLERLRIMCETKKNPPRSRRERDFASGGVIKEVPQSLVGERLLTRRSTHE